MSNNNLNGWQVCYIQFGQYLSNPQRNRSSKVAVNFDGLAVEIQDMQYCENYRQSWIRDMGLQ